MGKQFASMTPAHQDFITRQRIFFTASATATSRVNVSPRPTDVLRVLDEHTVAFLDLTGSGSETAAHLRVDGRITLMFCALDEPPSILRLYGRGASLPRNSSDYTVLQKPLREKALLALLIGSAAGKIEKQISGSVPIERAGTLETAVEVASHAAKAGDVVLLAPACASFDQFQNYEDRGRVFKELVRKLGSEAKT